MTTTENTTRSSDNTITRRKMLQSAAAVTAATLLPTQVATALEGSHTLPLLIEARWEARAALKLAWDKEDDLGEAFHSVTPPFVLVPFSVAADGTHPHGLGEFSVLKEHGIREQIESTHGSLRHKFASHWAKICTPETLLAAEEAIAKSEALALDALQAAVDAEAARREESGLAAAEREVEALGQADWNAAAAVSAYRPRSDAEVVMKVNWFVREHADGDFIIERGDLEALLPES